MIIAYLLQWNKQQQWMISINIWNDTPNTCSMFFSSPFKIIGTLLDTLHYQNARHSANRWGHPSASTVPELNFQDDGNVSDTIVIVDNTLHAIISSSVRDY